jgi:DNA polymerase-1
MDRNSRGGRGKTDAEIEDFLRLIDAWKYMGSPPPTEDEVPPGRGGGERFIAWVKRVVEGIVLPIRQGEHSGGPIKCVTTTDDLKKMLEVYLDFSEFTFDVETHGTRRSRKRPGPRVLSRYDPQASPCEVCGRPMSSRRRIYCSDTCRQSADKDKPALDTETNAVWCLSLAGPARVDVIPMGHPDKRRQLTRTEVFKTLEPLFFSDKRKIGQNVAFDLLSIAKYYDWEVPPPPYGDTMILAFLINENLGRYNLGALTEHYHGFKYAEKLGEEAYRVSWRRATRYSALDAKWAWMLWKKLSPILHKPGKEKLAALFDLEMKVMAVLVEMRHTGAYVDLDGFEALRPKLEEQLSTLEQEIYAMVGHSINLNSTQQLGKWLYDELRLHPPKLTGTGLRSTDAESLRHLARRHPGPRKILALKDVSKLLSVYVAGFLPVIEKDFRIRGSFNQARAKTGRLSCSEPNLQNIPARYRENTEGTMIRRLFIAPSGKVLIVADYSQIELRILAHQTRDPRLVHAYTHGLDLHTQTASLIWRIPPGDVDPEKRAIAKNSNFNFAFEGGPTRVVQMSGVSLAEATEVYDAWHAAYPGVKRWGSKIKRFCWDHGYVETLYGRKRRLPEIISSDWKERGYAERQAVNHPIQGTAADIAKVALVAVNEVLRPFDAALTLQVHDEFVIECSERQVEEVIPLVKAAMEDIQLDGHPVLTVPLEVNIGVGLNWLEAK